MSVMNTSSMDERIKSKDCQISQDVLKTLTNIKVTKETAFMILN